MKTYTLKIDIEIQALSRSDVWKRLAVFCVAMSEDAESAPLSDGIQRGSIDLEPIGEDEEGDYAYRIVS